MLEKKKVYLPWYRLLLVQRKSRKKDLFFSWFFCLQPQRLPRIVSSWKLNKPASLFTLYPYWILSSPCIKDKMAMCYFTYPQSLYAFGAKEKTFLYQRIHMIPPCHPLSWTLSILHWNHSYLFQIENVSYFLYILFHSLLSYTEKLPSFYHLISEITSTRYLL